MQKRRILNFCRKTIKIFSIKSQSRKKLTHWQRQHYLAIHSNAADDDGDLSSEAAIVVADVAAGDAGGAEQRYLTTL